MVFEKLSRKSIDKAAFKNFVTILYACILFSFVIMFEYATELPFHFKKTVQSQLLFCVNRISNYDPLKNVRDIKSQAKISFTTSIKQRACILFTNKIISVYQHHLAKNRHFVIFGNGIVLHCSITYTLFYEYSSFVQHL